VAEIHEQAKALDGKKVRIHAQVVKYNANIMGRNWLHLQDGTGDPMQNTHDLVITTTESLDSPRVITVEGTVAADKDFGAGYKYAVIVENCTIVE
jgi:aspartyl/asparaginyl-tRNA synthetase